MGKIELKPCPFCGVKKTWIRRKIGMYYVSCESCGSSTGFWFTEKQAIEAWNTRDEQTCKNIVDEDESTLHLSFVCSECGYSDDSITPKHCPECGAKVM